MISFFDVYDKYEIPSIILVNPDGTQLYEIGQAYDRKLNLRYNALSELTMSVPAYIKNGTTSASVVYYPLLVSRRLIYVENIGYFVITGSDESGDGIRKEKQITAMSCDYDFVVKKLTVFKGTYEFYDPITPAGTLIGEILSRLPNWSVGTIDADLFTLHRTFDITDSTLYNFLMEEVEKAYNCVFSFDYINRTLSAYSVTNATTNTDIYLSYDNLIQKVQINELTDELVTALSVYGSDPLSINQVNPLGTDTMYNFTYFKNTNWMSGSTMVNAVTAWENKVVANQPTYANLLTSLMTQNAILLAKKSELAELKSQLSSLEGVRNARIQQRLDIQAITSQVNAKQGEVTAKEAEIVVQQSVCDGITTQLETINTDLSFETNFTQAQQLELSKFIFGSTYTNSNFIQTDTMSLVDIQTQSQQLYDQALTVLSRVSQPRWTFEIDSTNFVFLKEFQTFINQLALGCIVSVEIDENSIAQPVLLEIDLDYDNPENFKLIFGNRLRLDSAAFVLSDLLGQSVQAGIDTNFQSEQWNNFSNNYQNDVSTFMTSALNAAVNNVISSTNQEIMIDQNGLTGKQMVSAGVYDPRQVKLVNNMLAFTKDNWEHASLVLGEILTSSGSAWGLIADSLVGNLIAGNELRISNDANTFVVDGGGATLTNAIFNLTTTNGNSQILLDPQDGIRLRGMDATSGSIINKLWLDANGNLNIIGSANIEGSVIANSGFIGGWRIESNGLYDAFGNYIRSDGNIRLGVLQIAGQTGIFNGNFYAQNLHPSSQFQGYQLANINADTITAGAIRGINIYGTHIYWPNGLLEERNGIPTLLSTNGRLEMSAYPYGGFVINLVETLIAHTNKITISAPMIDLKGSIYINGEKGYSGEIIVSS